MMIKSTYVIIKIAQKTAIIKDNALRSIHIRRAVITNNIKNKLDVIGMKSINKLA